MSLSADGEREIFASTADRARFSPRASSSRRSAIVKADRLLGSVISTRVPSGTCVGNLIMSFSTMAVILMALKLALTVHWARREQCACKAGVSTTASAQ
jgi:hypothetical protein